MIAVAGWCAPIAKYFPAMGGETEFDAIAVRTCNPPPAGPSKTRNQSPLGRFFFVLWGIRGGGGVRSRLAHEKAPPKAPRGSGAKFPNRPPRPSTSLATQTTANRLQRFTEKPRRSGAKVPQSGLAACDTGKPTNAIAQSVAPRSGARRGSPVRTAGAFPLPARKTRLYWRHELDSAIYRRLNRDVVTRSCATKEDALRLACDLMRRDCRVHFIMGPENQKVLAVEIIRWCKAHPSNDRRLPSTP